MAAVTPAVDPAQLEAARAQNAARKRAKLIHDLRLTVHVDDRSWTFVGGDATARHADALRAARPDENWVDPVWYVLDYLVANRSAPADIVARLVFLARLQQGDQVTLDEVLDSIPLAAVIWVDHPDTLPDLADEVAFPDPPPSGGS